MLMIFRVFHLTIFLGGTCGQFSSPYLVCYMHDACHTCVYICVLLKFSTNYAYLEVDN